GVIDIEALYGTLATLDDRQIDLVVELTEWSDESDRLGGEEATYTLLDVTPPPGRIPVPAGRPVRRLVGTAARHPPRRPRARHSAAQFTERIDRAAATRRRG